MRAMVMAVKLVKACEETAVLRAKLHSVAENFICFLDYIHHRMGDAAHIFQMSQNDSILNNIPEHQGLILVRRTCSFSLRVPRAVAWLTCYRAPDILNS